MHSDPLIHCICNIPECDIHIQGTSSDLEPFQGPIYKCWLLLEYMLFKWNYHPYLASHLITIWTSRSGFTQQVNKITMVNRDYFTLKKILQTYVATIFGLGFYWQYNAQSLQHECSMSLHLSIHPSFHPSEYAQDSHEVQCEGNILNFFNEFNTGPNQSSLTKTAHHCRFIK
jgi:hypothetical protein